MTVLLKLHRPLHTLIDCHLEMARSGLNARKVLKARNAEKPPAPAASAITLDIEIWNGSIKQHAEIMSEVIDDNDIQFKLNTNSKFASTWISDMNFLFCFYFYKNLLETFCQLSWIVSDYTCILELNFWIIQIFEHLLRKYYDKSCTYKAFSKDNEYTWCEKRTHQFSGFSNQNIYQKVFHNMKHV